MNRNIHFKNNQDEQYWLVKKFLDLGSLYMSLCKTVCKPLIYKNRSATNWSASRFLGLFCLFVLFSCLFPPSLPHILIQESCQILVGWLFVRFNHQHFLWSHRCKDKEWVNIWEVIDAVMEASNLTQDSTAFELCCILYLIEIRGESICHILDRDEITSKVKIVIDNSRGNFLWLLCSTRSWQVPPNVPLLARNTSQFEED